MKNWKVVLECKGDVIEETVAAQYYSDAYFIVEKKYPGCIVKSITEIKKEETDSVIDD